MFLSQSERPRFTPIQNNKQNYSSSCIYLTLLQLLPSIYVQVSQIMSSIRIILQNLCTHFSLPKRYHKQHPSHAPPFNRPPKHCSTCRCDCPLSMAAMLLQSIQTHQLFCGTQDVTKTPVRFSVRLDDRSTRSHIPEYPTLYISIAVATPEVRVSPMFAERQLQ